MGERPAREPSDEDCRNVAAVGWARTGEEAGREFEQVCEMRVKALGVRAASERPLSGGSAGRLRARARLIIAMSSTCRRSTRKERDLGTSARGSASTRRGLPSTIRVSTAPGQSAVLHRHQ